MTALRTSNFKRIYLGLLLDLLLLLALPAVGALLLGMIAAQLRPEGLESVTVAELLTGPSLAVKALYAALTLQYCLAALCALLAVSGLGELEAASTTFRRSMRWFVLLMVTEGVAMLSHITDVVRPESETLSLMTSVWLASLMLLMSFRALGLRFMLRGFGEVMDSVGAAILSRRALRLSRCVTAAAALAAGLLLASVGIYIFGPQYAVWKLLRALIVPAFLFYFLCRVQAVLCARAVTRRIAELSE